MQWKKTPPSSIVFFALGILLIFFVWNGVFPYFIGEEIQGKVLLVEQTPFFDSGEIIKIVIRNKHHDYILRSWQKTWLLIDTGQCVTVWAKPDSIVRFWKRGYYHDPELLQFGTCP